MSKFRKYGVRASEIARDAFAEYESAAQALRRAEDARREYPQRHGMVDAEYTARAARAAADVAEANSRQYQARLNMERAARDIASVRAELEASVASECAIDPAEVDTATMELLRSGICSVADYAELMQKAESSGNRTMMRLIAKSAADAAEAHKNSKGIMDDTGLQLMVIGTTEIDSGESVMDDFDVIETVYATTVRNPGLIPMWDELTSDALGRM